LEFWQLLKITSLLHFSFLNFGFLATLSPMKKTLGLQVMTHDRQGYQNTCVEIRNKTNP
jgi:hypothetical protein